MARRVNKQIVFSDYVIKLLDKHKDKEFNFDINYIHARELYMLAKYEEMSTSELSVIFNVGVRHIQVKLKEMNISRSLSEAQAIKNSKHKRKNEKLESKVILEPSIKNDYVIYRFVDSENKSVYIGSCGRSKNSYHKGGKKHERDYFLKQRLQHHYSGSQKHLPQFIYDDVVRIEYLCCDSELEMLELEGNLILQAKINGQCMWNGQYPLEITLDTSNVVWNEYKTLTEDEIKNHRLRF